MRSHPAHALVSRPPSPLAIAQHHTKQVGRRNQRVMLVAFLGVAIVVTLACVALWFSASR